MAAPGTSCAKANGFSPGTGPQKSIRSRSLSFVTSERIVVDIAEYGQRIFDLNASARDRLSNLRKLATAFLRDNVIDKAHQHYLSLT